MCLPRQLFHLRYFGKGAFDSPSARPSTHPAIRLRRSCERAPSSKNPITSDGVSRTAPQARLELATLRLQCTRYFHNGLDYLFILRLASRQARGSLRMLGACEAYWRESSSSSLCTFPVTITFSSRGFAQDCPTAFESRLGSPEFTQSLNPDCSGKLQLRHESHDDNSSCLSYSRMLYH